MDASEDVNEMRIVKMRMMKMKKRRKDEDDEKKKEEMWIWKEGEDKDENCIIVSIRCREQSIIDQIIIIIFYSPLNENRCSSSLLSSLPSHSRHSLPHHHLPSHPYFNQICFMLILCFLLISLRIMILLLDYFAVSDRARAKLSRHPVQECRKNS